MISDLGVIGQIHFVDDMIHREDGPAWTGPPPYGRDHYYLYDQPEDVDPVSELDWLLRVRKYKELGRTKPSDELLFKNRLPGFINELRPVNEL